VDAAGSVAGAAADADKVDRPARPPVTWMRQPKLGARADHRTAVVADRKVVVGLKGAEV